MRTFALTIHCTSGVHCGTCRNREGGRGWRTRLAAYFDRPPGGDDFECPHGKAWGYQQPPKERKRVEAAVPREKWPAWAAAAASHATPEDKGVGDTVARFTAASGLKSLVEGVKKLTGRSCGCTARQERWNARYPYQNQS